MLRRSRYYLVAFACLASCQPGAPDSLQDEDWGGLPITRAPQSEVRDKLSPYLLRLVNGPASGQNVRVLVDLSVQLDLLQFGHTLMSQGVERDERRRRVVDALLRIAEQSQSRLQPVLNELSEAGSIDSYRGFSIVNRLVVTAAPSAILELAEREEVADIVEETTRDALVLTGAAEVASPSSDRSWALDAMGVDSLWKEGATGRGTVVGIIDTGASAAHEQLQGNFRGGAQSWYDPAGRSRAPHDSRTGHGTTILSVAVGRNAGGQVLGVAPQAEWIACAGVPDGRYNNVTITECADWMLNVGQPDVLINAWLLPSPGCDRSLQRIVDAWRAAEMLPVFSAGNDGPAAPSDRSPANYAGLYPGDGASLSVGGTTRSRTPLTSSSRGPSSCDSWIFPALVAPGEDVMAAIPLTPSMYKLAQGTSVAAGLVAGAAAVLLQLHPQASVTELEEALKSSAVDLGPAGPDNTYGHGQLYLPAAADSLGRLLRRRQEARGDAEAGQRKDRPLR